MKISVIIPVYNAEKYLGKCLNSILKQRHKNIEVIVVDDGSQDNSLDICDSFSKKDERIKVFHKENGGVSSARNLGLTKVTGDWIAFVDADDYVDEDYLTIPAGYEGCDIVQKGYRRIDESKNKVSKLITRPSGIISTKEELDRFYVNYHTYALWNKLFKSSLIEGHSFDTTISIGEDFDFFLHILSDIKCYGFAGIGCYYYNVRDDSAMRSFRDDVRYQLKIESDNISHIYAMLEKEQNKMLLDGLVYGTYVPVFVKYYSSLDASQAKMLETFVNKIDFRALRILNLKKKVRLLIYLLKYRLFV